MPFTRHLLAGACVLALLFAALAGLQTWRADRLKGDLQTAEAQAETATKQADLNGEAVKIIDRTHIITQTIESKADAEAAAIREDVRGASPIDSGLLHDWRRALERVRSAGVQPDGAGAGEPAGAMPPT